MTDEEKRTYLHSMITKLSGDALNELLQAAARIPAKPRPLGVIHIAPGPWLAAYPQVTW